jgi:hypothetical protein
VTRPLLVLGALVLLVIVVLSAFFAFFHLVGRVRVCKYRPPWRRQSTASTPFAPSFAIMAARPRPTSTLSEYRDGNALEQLYEEIFSPAPTYMIARQVSQHRRSQIVEPNFEGGLDVLSPSRRAAHRLSVIDSSVPAQRWSDCSSSRPSSALGPPPPPRQPPPRSLWTVLARFAPAHEIALLVFGGFFAAAAGLARPMTSIILGNVRLFCLFIYFHIDVDSALYFPSLRMLSLSTTQIRTQTHAQSSSVWLMISPWMSCLSVSRVERNPCFRRV